MTPYLVVKFVHVLVAIVANGSSAGSTLWLRLAMREPAQLTFALRTAKFMDDFVTRPGLIVLLVSGFWMAVTRWSLGLLWARLALVLLAIVLLLLYAVVGPILGRLIRLTQAEGSHSQAWRGAAVRFELMGGGAGLIVLAIVWLMVTKPS
jgi:uncharacterized membrane protein